MLVYLLFYLLIIQQLFIKFCPLVRFGGEVKLIKCVVWKGLQGHGIYLMGNEMVDKTSRLGIRVFF